MPIVDTELIEQDKSRIIEMAWEDRTPFEAIKALYGLDEPVLMKLMPQKILSNSIICLHEQ